MKYYKFELSMTWANIFCYVLFFVSFAITIFTYGPLNFDGMGFVLLGLFLYLVIHEIIHGIAFSCFCKDKSNVKFGAMLEKGVLYAMCQERIFKKGALISLLAPTMVLTVLVMIPACIFRIDSLIFLALFNLAGASGDLLMTFFLVKLPNDVRYIDYDSVIGFYLLSKSDLSKYKAPFIKYTESGTDSDKLINKDIKRITITKQSWIVFAMLALVFLISYLVTFI